jgi:hypothetical protein
MKEPAYFKEINLPHINTEIKFMDMSKMTGEPIKGFGMTCEMDDGSIIIFIQDIEKSVKELDKMPYVAHEVIHAIQIICERLHAKAENEIEHFGYIMSYVLQELIK